MKDPNNLKKILRHLWLVSVLCTSCTHSNQWSKSKVPGSCKEFNSARMLYRSLNPLGGIDIELITKEDTTYLALIVHGDAIVNPHIRITIEGHQEIFEGLRHEGGQRIALPEEIKNRVVEALFSEKPIIFQMEKYREVVIMQ